MKRIFSLLLICSIFSFVFTDAEAKSFHETQYQTSSSTEKLKALEKIVSMLLADKVDAFAQDKYGMIIDTVASGEKYYYIKAALDKRNDLKAEEISELEKKLVPAKLVTRESVREELIKNLDIYNVLSKTLFEHFF